MNFKMFFFVGALIVFYICSVIAGNYCVLGAVVEF